MTSLRFVRGQNALIRPKAHGAGVHTQHLCCITQRFCEIVASVSSSVEVEIRRKSDSLTLVFDTQVSRKAWLDVVESTSRAYDDLVSVRLEQLSLAPASMLRTLQQRQSNFEVFLEKTMGKRRSSVAE